MSCKNDRPIFRYLVLVWDAYLPCVVNYTKYIHGYTNPANNPKCAIDINSSELQALLCLAQLGATFPKLHHIFSLWTQNKLEVNKDRN